MIITIGFRGTLFSDTPTYLVMFKIFQHPNGSNNGTFAKPWHNWVVSEILFAAFNTFGGWFGLNPSNDPALVSNTVEVIWDYPLCHYAHLPQVNRLSPYTTECERDVATWLDITGCRNKAWGYGNDEQQKIAMFDGKIPCEAFNTTIAAIASSPQIPMIQPYQPDHLFP